MKLHISKYVVDPSKIPCRASKISKCSNLLAQSKTFVFYFSVTVLNCHHIKDLCFAEI